MSAIVITIGGVDRTNSVIFDRSSFEQSMNAVPGTFEIAIRDPNRTLTFVTGVEITLDIDGARTFGGYVTQVSMSFLAPAADTTDLSTFDLRIWVLRGTDYNIIFDRRVVRNTADYLSFIDLSALTTDGAILRSMVANYADMSDFTTTGIADIATITGGDVLQQGIKIRDRFENLSFFGGAVWYSDGSKNLIYKPYDNVEKRWGFSDQPNYQAITASPASYQGALYGFRDVEGTEDGSYMVNDALIWGGSQFAGSGGGTVFSRSQDATSESTYGRWQTAETHFGDRMYAIQAQTDARASVIINGPPGADITGQQKGLKNVQWQFTFTWFSSGVPLLSGVPDHIIPGDIVTIDLETFGVTKLLPLRTLRTSFPDAFDADGTHLVQFEGTFGLQLSDPFTLWRYILSNQSRVQIQTQTAVTSSSTSATFGAYFQGAPTPVPDSSTTLFTIQFGYIAGTLQVYQNSGAGLALLRAGIDFTETSPTAGTFTMTTAPTTGWTLWAICSTLNG